MISPTAAPATGAFLHSPEYRLLGVIRSYLKGRCDLFSRTAFQMSQHKCEPLIRRHLLHGCMSSVFDLPVKQQPFRPGPPVSQLNGATLIVELLGDGYRRLRLALVQDLQRAVDRNPINPGVCSASTIHSGRVASTKNVTGRSIVIPSGFDDADVEGQLLEPQHQAEASKGRLGVGEFPCHASDAFHSDGRTGYQWEVGGRPMWAHSGCEPERLSPVPGGEQMPAVNQLEKKLLIM